MAKNSKKETPPPPHRGKADKQPYFKQSDFPRLDLQQAQRIPAALAEHFGGSDTSPPNVALAMNVSPTSSVWQTLTGCAIGYGLTNGGINANYIKLTDLGRRLVSPEADGEDLAARREAVLKPRLMREFFEKYRRAKFPADNIAKNVLRSLGLPDERTDEALAILKSNGKYVGIIRDTPTGQFVNLDSPGVPAPAATPTTPIPEDTHDDEDAGGESDPPTPPGTPATAVPPASTTPPTPTPPIFDPKANRVFITHGKHRGIVAQLKELLEYGHFEPIVSVERESTAIPVPEKVFEDMRSCAAGVIHVSQEGTYKDKDNKDQPKINDNVLIEIGAAMALYGKKVILLVEKGVPLPSNLQGLYRCESVGDGLDHDATMRLLKTFNKFR